MMIEQRDFQAGDRVIYLGDGGYPVDYDKAEMAGLNIGGDYYVSAVRLNDPLGESVEISLIGHPGFHNTRTFDLIANQVRQGDNQTTGDSFINFSVPDDFRDEGEYEPAEPTPVREETIRTTRSLSVVLTRGNGETICLDLNESEEITTRG